MFLAGEMSRLAINNSDAFKALQYGAAAAFMAFIFTCSAPRGSRCHSCTPLRSSHLRYEKKGVLGVSWDGALEMGGS
jgi:hypothetical protein